ncbi:heme-binding protein [Bradyrhizobium sp. 956_D2_N1_5]|uniref:heme-binding protein n=1 Tax=unclassified Bradyrhizobium TaxID=2631580 RepID=UPI003F2813E2
MWNKPSGSWRTETRDYPLPQRAGRFEAKRAILRTSSLSLVSVSGRVLIMDGATLLGDVGVSGDTSDNDRAYAITGIQAARLKANAG